MTSKLEQKLSFQLRALKVPAFECEYRFAAQHVGPGRGLRDRLRDAGLKDWRFDFAWPDLKLAAEVEGGAFVGGRHTRGAGFTEDIKKYHCAMSLGWTVYRCDSRLITSGDAASLLQALTRPTEEARWQALGDYMAGA